MNGGAVQQTLNAGLMFVHRHRRWTNINPALVERLMFAGYVYSE